jgi:pyridoxal phosphate enzyme (YggS family)
MDGGDLTRRVEAILKSLPPHVTLVAAAKTRTAAEVQAAIAAGVRAIGYNYVQEAEEMAKALREEMMPEDLNQVEWHLIGHLQRNKAKRAVQLFDMVETIDSERIAAAVNRHAEAVGKVTPVLIEINSGQESNKTGVTPDAVEALFDKIVELPHIKIQGLMTMGPTFGDPEEARPYFRLTKRMFDRLVEKNAPNAELRYLSMWMSNSYKEAIEEGANIVRIGTKLFGDRSED